MAVNMRHGFTAAILIAAQEPGPAAGYDEWQDAGWQVRKGEHARVWVPAGDGGRETAAMFTRSQVRPGRAGSPPPVPGAVTAEAAAPDRVVGALTAVARRRHYTVATSGDAARPVTDFGQNLIVIPAGLDPAVAAAALARELAYVVRAGDRPAAAGETTATRTGAAVVEADCAAWLVLTRLGLDPAAAGITFPAVRQWAGGDPRSPLAGLVTAAGERFTAAALQITAHAEKVLASLPPAPPAPPAVEPAAASLAGPGRSYGRYPRSRPAGWAQVTARPDWPCPDQMLIAANMAAAAWYRARLPGSWAEGYLRGRGFGPGICRRWQLGYAPRGRTGLVGHLRAAGFGDEVIEQAGLGVRYGGGALADYFRDRVMIPVRGPAGQVAGFAGRCAPAGEGESPKYINTRETVLYRKKHLLYGLPEAAGALAAGARPVRVEGYLDVIAVTTAAAPAMAGVTPGGTALTSDQVRLLAASCDLGRVPLLDACDQDSAGQKAAGRDYPVIAPYCAAAGAVRLPGKDPAGVFEQDGPAALAAALAAGEFPLADVAVDAAVSPWQDKLQWPVGQLGAARAAARLVAAFPPADVTRQILRVAGQTGLPVEVVNSEFIAAVGAEPGPSPRAERRPKGPVPGRGPDRAPDAASQDFPVPPGQAGRPAPGRRARPA
ncbi:MAG: toprim domain-containing protein, partial [Streptosporangiaceae bacterium]